MWKIKAWIWWNLMRHFAYWTKWGSNWPVFTGKRWEIYDGGKWVEAPEPPMIYCRTLGFQRLHPESKADCEIENCEIETEDCHA